MFELTISQPDSNYEQLNMVVISMADVREFPAAPDLIAAAVSVSVPTAVVDNEGRLNDIQQVMARVLSELNAVTRSGSTGA